MHASTLLIILLSLSAFAYYLGKRRAFKVAQGNIRKLHSLPTYYGLYTAIWCGLPALILVALWLAFEDTFITNMVIASLPEDMRDLGADRLNLIVNDIKNLVSGNIVSGEISPVMQAAADRYISLQTISRAAMVVLALAVAIGAGVFTLTKVKAKLDNCYKNKVGAKKNG
jgi:phosphate transport system permease protein